MKHFEAHSESARTYLRRATAIARGAVPRRDVDAAHVARSVHAAVHALGQTPTREQVAGALALMAGRAIELPTGEGKTLALYLAASALAQRGRRVMVLTANDYLSARDATAMAPAYAALEQRVANAVAGGEHVLSKRRAYGADVVYVSLREAVFDWLRDQTRRHPWHDVQRVHDVALVDEIDAGLLDQATVPYTLSGERASADGVEQERVTCVERAVASLVPERDYQREGTHMAALTDAGWRRVERRLVEAGLLPAGASLFGEVATGLEQLVAHALHAHVLLERGRHYLVRDGAVVLLDPNTGRLASNRRWGEGLHRAVQAKERVPLSPHPTAKSSTSARAFLSRFALVAGASGTVGASAEELHRLVGTTTVVLPPHLPSQREDEPERYFATDGERLAALVVAARDSSARGQPLLVGTWSELDAQRVSAALDDAGVAHATLSACDEEREADIIAGAARASAVTVATQLAGRGTDIALGGAAASPRERAEVTAAGGLRVIAMGRSDCARHDEQLRGRTGRRGDPGRSGTWVSLSDELARERSETGHRLTLALDRAQQRRERQRSATRAARASLEPILELQRTAFARARTAALWGLSPDVAETWLRSGTLAGGALDPAGTRADDDAWWAGGIPARVAREFEAVRDEGGDLRQFLARVFARYGVALRVRDVGAHPAPVRAVGELVRAGMRQTIARAADDVCAYLEDAGEPSPLAQPHARELVDQRLRRSAPRHFVRVARARTLVALDAAWSTYTTELPSLVERAHVERAARDSPERAFRRMAHAHFSAHWDAARLSIGQALLELPVPTTDAAVTALCEQLLSPVPRRVVFG